MPNYRIAYINGEGGVSVVIPASPTSTVEGMEALAQRMFRSNQLPEGTEAVVITTRDLPQNRHFRNAWSLDLLTRRVGVNITKAREIHRSNLRSARAAKMAALDTEYMRADEQNNQQLKGQIALQKQALRDLPQNPAIESALTPEALEALWPSDLLPNNPYKGKHP